MATPIPLQGTTITITDNLDVAQSLTGMKTISGFDGGAASVEDVTTLESTAKEKRTGLIDNGNFTLAGLLDRDDAGQIAAQDARENSDLREMVMTLSNGDIATFNVLVVSAPKDGSVDQSWQVTYSFEISGAIVWT